MFTMKKLMVLLIILAMVNVASAGIIDIVIASLNGAPITPTKEISIFPTDVVDMAITFEAPNTEYLFALGVTINVSGPASLLAPTTEQPIYNHADFDDTLQVINLPVIIEGASWLGPQGQGVGNPLQVVWNVLLHCDDIGDVLVYLTDDPLQNTLVVDEDFNTLELVWPWRGYSPANT